jgi:hypothetical protein
VKDFFWIGGSASAVHPHLKGAVLAVVNRQKKKPNDCASKPPWQQPLYIIQKRDATYLCGCCSHAPWSFTPTEGEFTNVKNFEAGTLRLLGRSCQLPAGSEIKLVVFSLKCAAIMLVFGESKDVPLYRSE